MTDKGRFIDKIDADKAAQFKQPNKFTALDPRYKMPKKVSSYVDLDTAADRAWAADFQLPRAVIPNYEFDIDLRAFAQRSNWEAASAVSTDVPKATTPNWGADLTQGVPLDLSEFQWPLLTPEEMDRITARWNPSAAALRVRPEDSRPDGLRNLDIQKNTFKTNIRNNDRTIF